MKIADLKVFIRVADAGSLSLAAAELGLAQPNVSRVVRNLERRLGAMLFNRTGRGVVLTGCGERFLAFALNTVGELDKVEREIGRLVGAAPRRLAIVIPRHTGRLLMPAIFRVFSARLPDVRLDIVERQSKEAQAALIGKGCDIAVFYDTTPSTFPDPQALFRESLYLTGHKKFLGESTDPISLTECASLPLLVFSNPAYARMVQAAFAGLGITPRNVTYLNNKIAMAAFAMEGQGVAFQAFSNFVHEFDNGEIFARKVVAPEIARTVMGAIGLHVDRHFAGTALDLLRGSLAEVADTARWRPVSPPNRIVL